MKRFFLSCACLGVLALVAATMLPPLREVGNTAFIKGEFMKYRVHYGLITAGYATVEIQSGSDVISGRKCHHIIGKGFTSPSYDWIYKIRDRYETYIDEKAMVPWKFIRSIDEGSFKSYTETHFDHLKGNVLFIDEKFKTTNYTVPANIQDVVSAFYYARTFNQNTLKVGDKIPFTNFLDRKVIKLEAKLLKREVIQVEGKKYKSLKFKLMVEEAGMITDGSKIDFWISDDDNKMLLRVASELAIGSIKVDLMETKNLKNPVTSIVP